MRKKERKIILKYLKELEEYNNKYPLPEDYHGYNGVTMITYGFMGCKTIRAVEIEKVAKEIGAKYW